MVDFLLGSLMFTQGLVLEEVFWGVHNARGMKRGKQPLFPRAAKGDEPFWNGGELLPQGACLRPAGISSAKHSTEERASLYLARVLLAEGYVTLGTCPVPLWSPRKGRSGPQTRQHPGPLPGLRTDTKPPCALAQTSNEPPCLPLLRHPLFTFCSPARPNPWAPDLHLILFLYIL